MNKFKVGDLVIARVLNPILGHRSDHIIRVGTVAGKGPVYFVEYDDTTLKALGIANGSWHQEELLPLNEITRALYL